MQLAAYISGDAESAALRASGGSDENSHKAANQQPGMLSPSSAALVLQQGTAGSLLTDAFKPVKCMRAWAQCKLETQATCGGPMDDAPLSAHACIADRPCTHAGASLGPVEQWTQAADLVKGKGDQASVTQLEDGYPQLKATVSDLLIWLNASNVGL